jgi:hypothetical protein
VVAFAAAVCAAVFFGAVWRTAFFAGGAFAAGFLVAFTFAVVVAALRVATCVATFATCVLRLVEAAVTRRL